MQRCLQCNSSLRSDETKCFNCGAAVVDKNLENGFVKHFRLIVNALFVVFAVLIVLSLFVSNDYVPSFTKCLSGLIIVVLVKGSIDHMSETKG